VGVKGVVLIIALVVAVVTATAYFTTSRRHEVGEGLVGPIADILGGVKNRFTVRSEAFTYGGSIPKKYTCDGVDTSLPVSWEGKLNGVKSFALIMYDPDAPRGVFYHWILYNIPQGTTSLPEGLVKKPVTAYGLQCINDFGDVGYGGPCPPPGTRHRYFIVVLALNKTLELPQKCRVSDLLQAVKGSVIAYGMTMGYYGR